MEEIEGEQEEEKAGEKVECDGRGPGATDEGGRGGGGAQGAPGGNEAQERGGSVHMKVEQQGDGEEQGRGNEWEAGGAGNVQRSVHMEVSSKRL